MISLNFRFETSWKCVGYIKMYLGARTKKDIKNLKEDFLAQ